ncbi:hypothetical protein K461DRAFT_105444 [Myriangium duriaei CBS 260.36]|uniref:Glycosyltransferase 2-like domain-containing protein n=1 Tax=Myriangium duriaei CBS 260.36 TaxID=1168546 RepID=A0A9P4MHN7_9PEZI|nr:hypothetical protein K461DRAFT_105444 [Myriangium duriaei CBS 260.36]
MGVFKNRLSSYLAPGRTPEAKAAAEYRKTRFISPAEIPVFPDSPEVNEKGSSSSRSGSGESPRLTQTTDLEKAAAAVTETKKVAPSIAESRPDSQLFPSGDFRNNGADELRDIRCDVMVNWLYQQQMEMLWTAGAADEGVVLKKARGNYTCCPPDIMDEPFGFFKSIEMLNVRSAMTVNTRVIKLFLHNNDKAFVPLKGGLRLQVLPDMTYLPRCQKHQFSAFIADRGILVVWDDEPKQLLNRAENIEKALMAMIWNEGESESEDGDDENKEKKESEETIEEVASEDGEDDGKPKKKKLNYTPRRPILLQPSMTALTLFATTIAIGSGYRSIAVEIANDGNWTRLLFVLAAPAQVWLGLFFFQACVGNLAQLFGPISQMNTNSKYYSGVPPKRLTQESGPLPHVTIQMPVYKEGLGPVIEPTIHSMKAAMSTYEMQGGSANIFINDDGIQLVSEEEARARQDFYDEHNIGWTSRPRHDPSGKHGAPFLRRGKFKKASNMNYGMWVSTRVEDKLKALERHDEWTQEDESAAYKECLKEVIEEDEGRTWADGNIRMGDYILIIDSDTRVPKDCIIDAISEMETSPEVAILQQASGVMNVTDSFFERGITFFTNLVYTQIRFAVASGDVAPFVGHNAFLRWEAIQNITYDCKDDHKEKWWSEATVSEDFDMALRLQSAGYLVRLGGYTNGGFEEGVSLTVYDELARWEKYAFGCNELIFFPIAEWGKNGVFTQLFIDFLHSKIPFPSKCTIMAYIGTYYALGSAWLLTLANYFMIGWMNGHLDHYYLDSFKAYFAIVVVFTILGNTSLGILRYRIEEQGFFEALWGNFKWAPMLTVFLGGISLHVSEALLSHMLGFEMGWGSTAKEAVDSTFFEEVPKIVKQFKFTLTFCFGCVVVMLVCAFALPPLWQIHTFIAVYPLIAIVMGHLLLPIVLNPNLMLFTF